MRPCTRKSSLPKTQNSSDYFLSKNLSLRLQPFLPKSVNLSKDPLTSYRAIMNGSYDWETFHDKEGKLLYVSPGIRRVIGYSAEDYLQGKITVKDFVHEDDREKAKICLEHVQHGRSFNDHELRFIHRKKHIVYVSVSAQAVRDGFRNIIGFRCSIRDITRRKAAEREHEFLSSITSQVSDSIIVTDTRLKIIFVNKATERLYGYSRKDLIGRAPDFLNAEPLAGDIQRKIFRTIRSGKTWVGRHLNRKKDKTTFICEFRISPIKNEKGEIYCYCAMQRDVTDKEEIRRLILAERDLGVYLGSAHDIREALRHILDAGLQIEGVDCGGIYLVDERAKSIDLIVHKGIGPAFLQKVAHYGPSDPEFKLLMKKEPVFMSCEKINLKDKKIYQQEELKSIAAVPIIHHHRVIGSMNLGSHAQDQIPVRSRELIKAIAAKVSGVILRLKVEAEFKRNAFHDSLTNIPNRRLFIKNLSQSIKRAKRHDDYKFAILFLDLDHFKDINDGLGHLTGDKVILHISQKLQNCVRANDTIARFGGDEFTVLLDGINGIDDAIDAANRIQIILSQPLIIEGREFYVTGSIGVLMYSHKYHSSEAMLRDADTAMYKAKLSGRARYAIFSDEMHTSAVNRIQIEHDLRKAIQGEDLKVYYQPIVSLRSGNITGVEALLRWHHPQKGIVYPNEFIPLAEEIGIIALLTEKVLNESAKQLRQWTDKGYLLRFAVNLSALNLIQQDLSQVVEKVLLANDLEPSSVELEITETAAMKDFDLALATLYRLSALGSRISIDDFGVGYAPLVYLKQYPVNKIKIDMAFIQDIPHDKNAMTITQAIIAMAHILNIEVVAEGVETLDQMNFLRKQGCDEIQGFLFSPAVPSQEIDSYLSSQKSISHLFPST